MATKKNEAKTRQTWKVLRAFAHEGTYYTGQDVPEIADLPKAVIEDREKRGYIKPYRAHVTEAPETTNTPEA